MHAHPLSQLYIYVPQSRQSVRLSLQSSELTPPVPREGAGGSQFRRRDRHSGTLHGKIANLFLQCRYSIIPLRYLPSRTKLWCTLQLRRQICSPYFYSTPICTLCFHPYLQHAQTHRHWEHAFARLNYTGRRITTALVQKTIQKLYLLKNYEAY